VSLLGRIRNSPGVLLFDLDGTLLPVGTDFFIKDYPDAAAPYFAHIIDPDRFKKALFESTFDMVSNTDPQITNSTAFGRSFERKLGRKWTEIWPIFERFYQEEFPKLARLVPESKTSSCVISACISQGWELVLATNPVFPETAIRERMRWCGVEKFPWLFITTLEAMHFCKPHTQYYQEIMDNLELDPERCVMIGNDVQEDMVAAELGMETILVEDYCINRDGRRAVNGDSQYMRGLLKDVPEITGQIIKEIT
jgi:FMN phosphatase YigB (HAD superfamily)